MPRIALCLQLGQRYFQRCLLGVQEGAPKAGGWFFQHFSPTQAGLEALASWAPDGVIAAAPNRPCGRLLAALPLPLIHLGNQEEAPTLPWVGPDHRAIGRAAATHLLTQGLRTIAFAGYPGRPFSDRRRLGCQEVLASEGIRLLKTPPGVWSDAAGLCAWLAALPRPTGIVAANDLLAWRIAEHARHAGLRIPEDLALVGADDDDVVGSLVHVPLSSVQISTRRIGLEAAALLTTRLAGDPIPTQTAIAPLGVVVRASSDLLQVSDPLVARVVREIAATADRPLSVAGIAHRVGVPRRTLERHVANTLGRSIRAEIERVRVERARALLSGSPLDVATIAQRCGFLDARGLTGAFRRLTGMPPTAYRALLAGGT